MSKSLKPIEVEVGDENPAQKLRSVLIRLAHLESYGSDPEIRPNSSWGNPDAHGYDPVFDAIEKRDAAIGFDVPEVNNTSPEWQKEAGQLLVQLIECLRKKGFKLVFK